LSSVIALSCGFSARQTVYLASGESGPCELRAAAVVSSAEADPLSLCHGLLAASAQRGA
jgi:hypothetical protein